MKRSLLSCFLALALTLGLTACGASAAGSKADNAAYSSAESITASAPMETMDAEVAEVIYDHLGDRGGNGGSTVLEDQKIIYTGDINLETTEFDDTVTALTTLAESSGGYLQSSTVGSGSRGYRWADYTVRVPSDQFQRFLEQTGSLAHVTWQNTDQQNITETYYDTAGRLKTQQIKLERLQSLLSQAENMEDIITIESAISETEWEIEELSGTLRRYDTLVDYATVNLHIDEVYKLSNTETVPESFGDRLGSAFTQGLSAFGDGVENFAVLLAYNWLWMLLWAAVIAGAVVLLGKLRRRRKAGKTAKSAGKAAEKQDDKPEQT